MKQFHYLVVALVVIVAACDGESSPTTTDEPVAAAAVAVTTSAAPSTTVATTTTLPPTTTTVAPTTTTTVAPTTTTAITTTTTTAAPTTTTAAPTTTAPPATTTTSIGYVAWGAELAGDLGCQNCHSTNGSAGLGPTWSGLAGSTVPLADGSSVTATAGYIEESIRFPDAKIVVGFSPGLMQGGYNSLSEGEIAALVAFVSSR